MARKGTQPALYELIRSRTSTQTPSTSASVGSPSGVGRSEPESLAPGVAHAPVPSVGASSHVLRVPVGYVYAAIAILLAATVAGYLYGVSVGERIANDRLAQQRHDEANAASRMPEIDPLNVNKLPESLVANGATGGGAGRGNLNSQGDPKSRREGALGSNDSDQALGPPSGSDPRTVGLNYFVLAHTARSNGQAMVDFCRKNGLDAHLVPDDTAELRLVVVVPGFTPAERQSVAVRAIEAKIRSVGLKWKSAARGNRDFFDAYPSKFQGARAPGSKTN